MSAPQHCTLPSLLAAALALGLSSTPALAQIEEVLVTAQKREESLQATPIAISTLSGDSMEKMGITSFEEVALATPALNFSPYPSSASLLILYMRGQGVSDPMQITVDGSVGMYQDGFYIARPQGSAFDLADIERVEVLRGPQGTLYGRNTTGGAVNLISKKPSGEFNFKQTLTAGNYNYFRSLTTVDLPEWQGLATKFTVLKSQKDGYVRNRGSSHDFGEKEELSGRFSLHWQALDNLTVDYFAEHGEIDATPLYYQNPWLNGETVRGYPYVGHDKRRSRSYRPVDLPLSKTRFEGHGLTLAWEVSEELTIKSLTGYRDLHWTTWQDYMESFTTDFTAMGPISTVSYDVLDNHQFTQEFQFIGTALDGAIDYVAGLYYFDESGSHFERFDIEMPALNAVTLKDRWVSSTSKSHAAYAQVTWTPPILEQRMDITLGARYTRDKRTGKRRFIVDDTFAGGIQHEDPAQARNNKRYSKFNPALTVNYNWNDDLSTYAKVVTAYKAGGATESSPLHQFTHTHAPEEVISYELGLKSHWLDRRLRLNVAAFHSEFDDMQLTFTADRVDSSINQAYNAGEATVQGVELELLYAPTDNLNFNLDYAWLDPKFDRVKVLEGTIFDPAINPNSPYQVGDSIRRILALPYAPRDTVNAGIDYRFWQGTRAELSARLDYHFESTAYHTAPTGPDVPGRKRYRNSSYGVFNGRLSLDMDLPRGDALQVSLWGKNLFNKKYPVHTLGLGSPIATAQGPAGWTQTARQWNEPTTWGVELIYRYR